MTARDAPTAALAVVAVEDIITRKGWNPRAHDDQEEAAALTASVRAQGLLQPLVVERGEDGPILIDGHRRLVALRAAGHATAPVIYRDGSAGEASQLTAALAANLRRRGLGPIEEARAYERAIEAGWPQRRIAEAVGCPRRHVSERLRLLRLPEAVQDAVAAGALPLAAVRRVEAIAKVAPGVAEALAVAVRAGAIEPGELVEHPDAALARLAEPEAEWTCPLLVAVPGYQDLAAVLDPERHPEIIAAAEVAGIHGVSLGPDDMDAARAFGCLIEFRDDENRYFRRGWVADADWLADRVRLHVEGAAERAQEDARRRAAEDSAGAAEHPDAAARAEGESDEERRRRERQEAADDRRSGRLANLDLGRRAALAFDEPAEINMEMARVLVLTALHHHQAALASGDVTSRSASPASEESGMRSETPVLIVGGGPTGLAASLTLSHLGVPSVLVNKYPGTLEHPKAVGIMQRTAELLRLWGAEDEVRRRGVPREFCERMVWTTTLAGEELGRTETVEPDDKAPEPQSPTTGLRCPQDITESTLRGRAEAHDIADLHYGFEMTGFEQDDDGVTATIIARGGGEPSTVRAQYLIAADGNDSTVRHACGIGRAGDADMGRFVNIFHRAPLGPLVRDRPGWSYAVITPHLTGSFVTIDGDDSWLFHVNLAPGETVEDFTEQRCVDTVRHAAGVDDLDVEVISIKSWVMGAELSTAFRDRRVLLTGDAAHRTTPDGGVGMNTGLHSAHNLAWTVGAVVSGWAGPDLLDTYETERRAVAETNVAYSARRGGGMIKMIEAVRAGDLDTVRAGIAARPAGGRQGMDLGFRYEEGAVASDGTTPPPVENPMAEYVQNACPGGRAPHLWVQRDGERVSTLDAFGGGLVLLTGSDGAVWRAAAEQAAAPRQVPIEVLSVGEAGDLQAPAGRFETLYGVEPDGVALVRPDGFVGWRAQRAGETPADDLAGALATILKL